MNARSRFLFILFVHITGLSGAQTLRGVLLDAAAGSPIVGAALQLQPERDSQSVRAMRTDSDGQFAFTNCTPGFYQLSVDMPGYAPRRLRQIQINAGKETVLELALQNAPSELPGVEITAYTPGRRAPQAVSEIPLAREQTLRFPATFFDPARLALAYPGIVNTDDQANGLSIRGNGPGSLRWRLEGVEVVNPNHLSNAGTFNDLPAPAAGGVLLFSAQLMDNSALRTGALPAGYGDALGGVMDINLRKGNQQQREFTAQAGLIGLDLAAEGPIKKNRSSYLANYRYSTVGLLGNLGVSFGGETINFQDLSVKLDFTGKKGGQWSFFAIGGLNATVFEPPADSGAIQQYKDLFNIRFDGRTGIAGLQYWNAIGSNTWLRAATVLSARDDKRRANGPEIEDLDNSAETRLGLSLTLSHRLAKQHRILAGWYHQTIRYQLERLRNGQADALGGLVGFFQLQPWAQWEYTNKSGKTSLHAGLHAIVLSANADSLVSADQQLEPRLQVTHRFNTRHQLAWSAGLQSQMQPLWLYAARPPQGLGDGYRIPGLTRSVQTGVRYTWMPGADWVVRGEAAYQWLYKAPVAAGQASVFSMLNVSEITLLDSLRAAGNGENASLEVSLERYFDGNWFLLLNGALLRARYRGSDQVWRDSRWNFQNMINLSAGKEWQRKQHTGKNRAFGLSARLTSRGGFRAMPVNQAASAAARTTVFETANGFSQQLPAFFRTDVRVYWRRHTGNRRNSTLALEIQNVTARQNIAYFYYDPFLEQVETKYQLGLLPNLSWRLEF